MKKAQSYWNLFHLEKLNLENVLKNLTGSPRGKKEVKGRKAVKAKLEPSPTKFVFRSQKASHRAAPKQGVYEKRQKDTNDQIFGFISLQRFLAVYTECLQ